MMIAITTTIHLKQFINILDRSRKANYKRAVK